METAHQHLCYHIGWVVVWTAEAVEGLPCDLVCIRRSLACCTTCSSIGERRVPEAVTDGEYSEEGLEFMKG